MKIAGIAEEATVVESALQALPTVVVPGSALRSNFRLSAQIVSLPAAFAGGTIAAFWLLDRSFLVRIHWLRLRAYVTAAFATPQEVAFAIYHGGGAYSAGGGAGFAVTPINKASRPAPPRFANTVASTGAVTAPGAVFTDDPFMVWNGWAGPIINREVFDFGVRWVDGDGDYPYIIGANETLVLNSLIAWGAGSKLSLVLDMEWSECRASDFTDQPWQ